MRITIWFSLLALASCSNELMLNADFRDIPIVYGLLSLEADNLYIRVERAFLDPSLPPDEVALIPDSIYYKNAKVYLSKNNSAEPILLEEIDGQSEGLPRDEGAFATMPNKLYKILSSKLNLKAGDIITLQIDRGSNLPIVTADTKVIDSVLISIPSTRINFDYINNFTVQWFPKSEINEPHIYDVNFLIHFREINVSEVEPKWKEASLIWNIAKNVEQTRIQKSGREFYLHLANNLREDVNLRREILSIDVIIDSGGQEILDYTRVGLANLGITASQEIPFYSNISEGRGIFSSRNRNIRKRILLSAVTQDSLANGQFTRNLNFLK